MLDNEFMDELIERLERSEAKRMGWLMPCYQFTGEAKHSLHVEHMLDKQIEKTEEELQEVREALRKYLVHPDDREARKALLMECVDVQVSIETLMRQLGACESERNAIRRLVWEKNHARGYYKKTNDID